MNKEIISDPICCNTYRHTFLSETTIKPIEPEKPERTEDEKMEISRRLVDALNNVEDIELDLDSPEIIEARKCLKSELAIWKKNEQAFFNLTELLCELESKRSIDEANVQLLYKVFSDLQDPEIKVDYKGDSLIKHGEEIKNCFHNLRRKYTRKYPEFRSHFSKIIPRDITTYLQNKNLMSITSEQTNWYDKPYDLKILISEVDISSVNRLLLSMSTASSEAVSKIPEADLTNLSDLFEAMNCLHSVDSDIGKVSNMEEDQRKPKQKMKES